MADRAKKISIDLSKLLNDEVSDASVNGTEYSAAYRLLAVNKAEEMFITGLIEKEPVKEITKRLSELVAFPDYTAQAGISVFDSPPGSAKVIAVYTATDYIIPVKPEEWDAVRLGYNPEDTGQLYGTTPILRWSEWGKKVSVFPAVLITPSMKYIKDHIDIVDLNANADLIIPARYDPALLKMAFEYIVGIKHGGTQ